MAENYSEESVRKLLKSRDHEGHIWSEAEF